MPRIGVDQEPGVRKVLDQAIGIRDRNHLVMHPVHHEPWMVNGPQLGESLARETLPLAKGGDLVCGRLGTRGWIAILHSLREPSQERFSRGLARLGRREEDLLQHRVSLETRVRKVTR